MKVRYSPDGEESELSLDTGCGVILGDRVYLLKQIPRLEIKKIASSIPVRGVGNKIIYSNEYAIITIYVTGLVGGVTRTTYLTIEVYIVDNLKANILIGTNIITP